MTPVLLTLALAVAAPTTKDAKKDPPPIVGEWAVESAVSGGKPDNPPPGTWELESATYFGAPVPDLKLTMTFKADGGYESSAAEAGRTRAEAGTYARDPKQSPAHLDLGEPGAGGGRPSLAIYKVDG